MEAIDWTSVTQSSKVTEVSRIVETFCVRLKRGPNIRIEIHEYPSGNYEGVSSHSFWGPKQISPYRSSHMQNSIESALNDSIRGFLSFDSDDFSNEDVFFVTEDVNSNEKIYIDGDCEVLTFEEVNERRQKYNQHN